VNLGVTEHLPNYAATLRRYQRLLKPGGRVFLDACATAKKHPFSTFTTKIHLAGQWLCRPAVPRFGDMFSPNDPAISHGPPIIHPENPSRAADAPEQ